MHQEHKHTILPRSRSQSPYILNQHCEFPCPLEGYPNKTARFTEDEVMGRELQEYTELNQHNTVEVAVLQRTTNEVPLGLSANWMEVLCRGSKMAYRVDALWNYGTDQSSAQDFVCYCSDRPYSWRALFLSIPLCLIP